MLVFVDIEPFRAKIEKTVDDWSCFCFSSPEAIQKLNQIKKEVLNTDFFDKDDLFYLVDLINDRKRAIQKVINKLK